ncbi:hypothetical protein H0H93_003209 [Arthromyces matolae]|nr:hypothetical protein H0H93_003209 [Arthromyces matolae]
MPSMDGDDVSVDLPPRKRQRQDLTTVQRSQPKAPRLFLPFRALGLITNYVPFVLQSRSFKGSTEAPRLHILTCLGRSWALWEGGKMTLLFVGPDALDQISSLAMDGDAVWAAAGPNVLKYIRGKEVLRVVNPLGAAISYITIFGTQILALTEDGGRMLIWDTKEGGLNATLEFEAGFTATSILHPATYLNKILVASSQGNIQLWNIHSQTCIHKFPLHRLQSTPPGNRTAIDSGSAITAMVQSPAVDVVGICPPEVQQRTFGAKKKQRCITGLATDALNRVVIASTLDGTVNFFDFQTAKLEHTIVLPSAATSISLHSDNGLLAVVSDDMIVRIIDIETRRIVRELGGFRGRILDITFSPDSRWLVTTSLDSIIRTFDIPTGRLIDAFRTPSVATSISFSPTNDFLATAHVDSVGIFLCIHLTRTHRANRAQYDEVSFQTVTDEDLSNVNLPSMQGVAEDEALDALSALKVQDAPSDVFSTPPQLEGELVTLTLLPRARWQTLLNLEVIQQRNKPKEPPKAPEKAPFFLPTLPGVEMRFTPAEPKDVEQKKPTRRMEKVAGSLESTFYKNLMVDARDGNYETFFSFAKTLSPAALDLEIRSLVTLEGFNTFINALTQRLISHRDFEAVQAMQNVFLNIHSDAIVENEELQENLERLLTIQKRESQRILDLITSSLGTLGFNASAIDSLLDKEDVQLEAILDEDDLLQECKSQNTRLIDYFQRVDVLQKLLGYVTGQIEGDEKGRFKYPYVATEVLCSEIWSIVETCINEQQQLLAPFWETILDRTAEDMKTHMVMASHFSKINGVFLSKKPAEMFAFIRSQPRVVERLLVHIEIPSLVDLIVRIIQLDEQPSGAGVLEWLSSENLTGRLIELLSPAHSSDVHAVVADLIKGIISMATPSPGAAGFSDGLNNGVASNRFARELAMDENMERLASYSLLEFEASASTDEEEDEDDPRSQNLPNFNSKTSSVVNGISMVTELIRKNNSDFFEPYLFHTLRNRLMHVQPDANVDRRGAMEQVMSEMVERMGVVHLGPMLEIMIRIMDRLQHYLRYPRSTRGPLVTTVGAINPLTQERLRITELFAELIHCSSMSLLNRPAEMARLYDSQGRLNGGLGGLEDLAQILSANNSIDRLDDSNDDLEPSLPISSAHDSMTLDSDESMSDEPGSSDDEAMEEIAMYDDPPHNLTRLTTDSSIPELPLTIPSSPISFKSPVSASPTQGDAYVESPVAETAPTSNTPPHARGSSRRNSRRSYILNGSHTTDNYLPVGERLKQRFLDLGILSTLLDLFFEFPWNNFLHVAVYDVVHQVLNAPVETGYNRELAISLFRDARIMERIVDGQKHNDAEALKNNGTRLGYMGHLTFMADDVITALEHFPPELRLILITYAPSPGWDDYVVGRYNETKRKDARLLGGGKPQITPGTARSVGKWKVDEGDADMAYTASASSPAKPTEFSEPRGEFKRATSTRPARASSADFGPATMMEDSEEDEAPHFARYLAQEMHTKDSHDNTSDDEDDDEEGGWLSQSTFSLTGPPISARPPSERRPLSAFGSSGFDDAFTPSNAAVEALIEDPFNPNIDDGFGPFSDTAAVSNHSGEYSFSSFDDSFDESFGDFGDFQSAELGSNEGEGSLTPTTGSWTLASDPDDSEEDRALSVSPPDGRMDAFGFGGMSADYPRSDVVILLHIHNDNVKRSFSVGLVLFASRLELVPTLSCCRGEIESCKFVAGLVRQQTFDFVTWYNFSDTLWSARKY